MQCHFLELAEEIVFFVTTLEEDCFSPLYLFLILREEDVLNSTEKEEEEDVGSINK
jgi:hypothetical protein